MGDGIHRQAHGLAAVLGDHLEEPVVALRDLDLGSRRRRRRQNDALAPSAATTARPTTPFETRDYYYDVYPYSRSAPPPPVSS